MAAYHPAIAIVIQQTSYPSGFVVVVYVQPPGLRLSSAQRTPAFLKLQLVVVLARTNPIQLLESAVSGLCAGHYRFAFLCSLFSHRLIQLQLAQRI